MFFRYISLLYIVLFAFEAKSAFARSAFYTPAPELEHQDKKRITEILRKENYKIIEPYYYVTNRPTLQQALSHDIRDSRLVSPENHMTYCPPGQDYYTHNSLGPGTIYIGAENLPKNGSETSRWFMEAYRYRLPNDPDAKEANVTIVTAKRRNFFRVKCPQTHNHIIVSHAPAPYRAQEPQMIIDGVKNLRHAAKPDVKWDTDEFTLPSHTHTEYIQREERVTNKKRIIELSPPDNPELIAKIRHAAQSEKVFIKLALAIAEVGSEYDPNARVRRGLNLGLMATPQNIKNIAQIPLNRLFDPKINSEVSLKLFRNIYRAFSNDLDLALRAYYLGITSPTDSERLNNFDAENFSREVQRRLDPNQPLVF